MSKVIKASITLLMAAMLSTGCTWNRQDTGTALGAVAGGVIGNAATGGSAAGTIAGAVGGGYVGNRLSR